jgi:hypothetical protein
LDVDLGTLNIELGTLERKMCRLIRIGLILLFAAGQIGIGQAQENAWSEPVNLSVSGSAEQPRLVAAPDGRVQAFWWDRFDGLTTTYFDGSNWSPGSLAPLEGFNGQALTVLMDTTGWVHAFWLKEEPGGGLWHASMQLGGTSWGLLELLTDSALVFEAQALANGAMVLAYLRIVQSDSIPAGIFVQTLEPGAFTWNIAQSVESSAYFRLETVDTSWLYLAVENETLRLTWREPRQGEYRVAESSDGGSTWHAPQTIIAPVEGISQPRSMLFNENSLLVWQTDGQPTCQITQQTVRMEWQAGLIGLTDCPIGELTWQSDGLLFWLWGQGSSILTLAAWDGFLWTSPVQIRFNFIEAESGRSISLQDLHGMQAGGRLFIIGSDPTGEAWFVQGDLSALALLEAPQPAWGTGWRLSNRGQTAGVPALAVDAQTRFHITWAEGTPGGTMNTLYYSRLEGETITQPAAIQRGLEGEFIRAPVLLAHEAEWLHLAWSGGTQGEILYSRAQLDEAGNPNGWSQVQVISEGAAANPQLGQDSAGRLYLLYVTPINEGRGVYLVRSADEGETWMQPEKVFDAAEAGWSSVGAAAIALIPSLTGSPEVTVEAVWVKTVPPGTLPAQGIFYSRASSSLLDLDGLEWSEPFEVAGAGADWPQLSGAGGNLYLFYTLGSSAWERWLPIDVAAEDVSSWSTAMQVPGWTGFSTSEGSPVGLAMSGSVRVETGAKLHLAGMPEGGDLQYSSLSESRWSNTEVSWEPSLLSGPSLATKAACLPTGGRLGLTWLSLDEQGLPAVFLAVRAIAPAIVPPEAVLEATPTPLVTPTEEATPTLAPSPTPDLNQMPIPSGGLPDPRILGGVTAALLVVGFMLLRRFVINRR